MSSASAAASSRVARRRSSTDSSAAWDRNVAVAAYPPRSRAQPPCSNRAATASSGPHAAIPECHSTRSGCCPRHPQPPAPDESDVVARAGWRGRRRSTPGGDGTRPAGRTRPGPGSSWTLSATDDVTATSEPDQMEVLDDGSVVIAGAVAGKTENHAREQTARRPQPTSRQVVSRMRPPGNCPGTRLPRGHGKSRHSSCRRFGQHFAGPGI